MERTDIERILACCDHTLLSPSAEWKDIRQICDEGMKYGVASVCIPPCFVKRAREYADLCQKGMAYKDRLRICTVIGFPNGYSTTDVKKFEAAQAIVDGADEIDVVANIGALKAGDEVYILDEIRALKETCGKKILKVIIETCLLTEEEKLAMCHLVTEAGADFIKTSTGFSKGGATKEDVALLKANVGENVQVKAAGGISSLDDALAFLELGASRLGTSRIIGLVKQFEAEEAETAEEQAAAEEKEN